MSPRIFVSPRHKSCGDQRSRTGLQSGQAIVREGAQRPVMKYIYIQGASHNRRFRPLRSLGRKNGLE